jgi:hypothetical protein
MWTTRLILTPHRQDTTLPKWRSMPTSYPTTPFDGWSTTVPPPTQRKSTHNGLVLAEAVEQATALLESVNSDDLGDRRVLVHLHTSQNLEELAWRPDHEVFPELTIYPGSQP